MSRSEANRRRMLCAALACAALLGVAPAAGGVLYECRGQDRPPNYLLATMHADDPRVLALAGPVAEPLRDARRLVLELVPDGSALLAAMLSGFLPQGQRLPDLLGPDLYAAVEPAMLARGVLPGMLERMRPWAVAMELSLPAGERGVFLDLKLYELAVEAGLEVVGLETVAEQLGVFDVLSPQQQARLVREAVKNLPRVPQQYEEMVLAYAAGDLQRLLALADSQQADLPADLAAWFERQMVRERNARMRERLQPLWAEGGAVVAVGALHLVGDNGLLAAFGECDWRTLR